MPAHARATLRGARRAGRVRSHPRRGAARRRMAACVLLALALGGAAAVGAQASTSPGQIALAERLAAEDPGAVLGGDTIVATGNGAFLFGVPDRPNVIFALGRNEVVFGGQGRNEIIALAANATVYLGRGSNYVWAGTGATVFGGAGRNLLIDTGARSTVFVRSTATQVVMYGRHGRVLCSHGARGALLYISATDLVGRTCRAVHTRVLPVSRVHGASPSPRVGAPNIVTGDGSNDNPYVAPCDDSSKLDCVVSAFPSRTLDRFGANEYVPAYRCPSDHPYLLFDGFAPYGSTWGPGVQVGEDWGDYPIGVSITHDSAVADPGYPPSSGDVLATGTLTGFPNSSATNWNGKSHWYQVKLYCTSDRCHGVSEVSDDPNIGLPPNNCLPALRHAPKRTNTRLTTRSRLL